MKKSLLTIYLYFLKKIGLWSVEISDHLQHQYSLQLNQFIYISWKNWSLKCWDFRPFTTSIFSAAKHSKVQSPDFQIWVVGYYVEFVDEWLVNIWIVCIHWRVSVLVIDTGREWGSVWGRDWRTFYVTSSVICIYMKKLTDLNAIWYAEVHLHWWFIE